MCVFGCAVCCGYREVLVVCIFHFFSRRNFVSLLMCRRNITMDKITQATVREVMAQDKS